MFSNDLHKQIPWQNLQVMKLQQLASLNSWVLCGVARYHIVFVSNLVDTWREAKQGIQQKITRNVGQQGADSIRYGSEVILIIVVKLGFLDWHDEMKGLLGVPWWIHDKVTGDQDALCLTLGLSGCASQTFVHGGEWKSEVPGINNLGSMLDFDAFSSWIYKPLILTRKRTELVELS